MGHGGRLSLSCRAPRCLTLPNGDSLYMFFGGVRADQDSNPGANYNANGAHSFGIATSSVSYDPGDARHEARFNFNRGLSETPRHVGWLDTTSPNYSGLRDAGVKVKRWEGTTDGVGQEVDGWFTPLFARIATRSFTGTPFVSRFGPIAGMYIDGYFYLFIGVTGTTPKGCIG